MNTTLLSTSNTLTARAIRSTESQLGKAVKCYIDRQNRDEHPSGYFDNVKRWKPFSYERCECCNGIRSPSMGFPFSLMVHCRSITHIAQLYEVDESMLRKAVKTYKMANC